MRAERFNAPLTRQRKWQINRIAAGMCETCGEPREESRANRRHCKSCAELRGERERKRRELLAKARSKDRAKKQKSKLKRS